MSGSSAGTFVDLERARELDENLDTEQAREIAIGRLLSMTQTGDTRDESNIGPVESAFRTVEKFNRMEQRLAQLEDKLDEIDRNASKALTVAESGAKQGDSPTKKRIAMLKTRNELLRATAAKYGHLDTSDGKSVTTGKVQDMAKPNTKLYHQTIADAWDELAERWDAFSVGTNEAGNKVCRVTPEDLDPKLVKTVEDDLDRDDLTKRLLSEAQREGL